MVRGAASEEVRGAALNNISDQTSSTPAEQSSGKSHIEHRSDTGIQNLSGYKDTWLWTTLQIFLLTAILRSSDPKIPSKSSHQCVMYYKTGWWTCKRHKTVIMEVNRLPFMPVAHEGQAGHMASSLSAFKKEKSSAPCWLCLLTVSNKCYSNMIFSITSSCNLQQIYWNPVFLTCLTCQCIL